MPRAMTSDPVVLMWEPATTSLSRPSKGGLDELGAQLPWEGGGASSPWGP